MIQETSDVPRLMWKIHEGAEPPSAALLEGRPALVAKANAAFAAYFEACCVMRPNDELAKLWHDVMAAARELSGEPMTDAEKVDLLTLQLSYEKGALETATRLDVTEPFGTIKEVWVDGVKFVLDEKATLEHLYEVLKKRDG